MLSTNSFKYSYEKLEDVRDISDILKMVGSTLQADIFMGQYLRLQAKPENVEDEINAYRNIDSDNEVETVEKKKKKENG